MKLLATQFHEALLSTYHIVKRECGYNATYFIRMLNELGGVEAAHRLLSSTNPAADLTAAERALREALTVGQQSDSLPDTLGSTPLPWPVIGFITNPFSLSYAVNCRARRLSRPQIGLPIKRWMTWCIGCCIRKVHSSNVYKLRFR